GPRATRIPISSAVYDPTSHTVTLRPKARVNLHKLYTLTVVGTGARGMSDSSGTLLDGASNGKPGSNFVTKLTEANLVIGGSVPGGPVSQKHPSRSAAKLSAHHSASLVGASATNGAPSHTKKGLR